MNILIHQSSLLSERNCPWSQREGEAHSEIIRADASFLIASMVVIGSWLTRYDPRKSIHPITIDIAIKPLPTSLGIHHIDSSQGSNSG